MADEDSLTAEEVLDLARRAETDDTVVDEHFDDLFRYFTENGEMPYATAKARDGDPHEWISQRLVRMV